MQFRRLILQVWAAVAALLCAASSCSGNPSAPDNTSLPEAAATVQPPAPIEQGGRPALPSPAELLRSGSTVLTEPFAYGADFDPAASHPEAEARGRVVHLATADTGERDELGFYPIRPVHAVYRFDLSDYNGPPTFKFSGHTAMLQYFNVDTGVSKQFPMVWLGLSNWQTGRWQWFQLEDGNELELPSLDPYRAEDGTLLLVWMSLQQNMGPGQLNWLRIGDSPMQPQIVDSTSRNLRALAVTANGNPTILAGHAQIGFYLLEQGDDGWQERALDLPGGTEVRGLAYSPDSELQLLTQRRTVDPEAQLLTQETLLMNVTASPPISSVVRSFSIPNPGGPGGPGGGGGDYPTIRSTVIDFDLAGEPQVTYLDLDGRYTAWQEASSWSALKLPGAPLDFGLDADGAACVATRVGGYTGPINLSRRAGLEWFTEPLTTDDGQWDAWMLDDAGTMRVLVSQADGPVRLFTYDGGAWQPREYPEESGQNPRDIVAATIADGRLRLADRAWVYNQGAGDTLVAVPIEFSAEFIVFDATGKLHAAGARNIKGSWQVRYTCES